MELFIRSFVHTIHKFVFLFTGFINLTTYINNIKRIKTLSTNDYRDIVGEEFSAESQGSCDVVQKPVSDVETSERTSNFEYPDKNETVGPEHDSTAESNENTSVAK